MGTALIMGMHVHGQEDQLILGERFTTPSKILGEDRTINIYRTSEAEGDLHVFYLLDGSWDEDLIPVCGLIRFASFPWVEMIPQALVVGITNVDRRRDLTHPTSIEEDRLEFPTTGGSERFMRFVNDELRPEITRRYGQAASSTLIGQSFGGLFALEVLRTSPGSFNNYIMVSPSLWWDKGSLIQQKQPEIAEGTGIYIAWGAEGEQMDAAMSSLQRSFEAPGSNKAKIMLDHLPDHDHADAMLLAVYRGLRHLFKK